MRLFVLLSRVPYPLEKGDKLRAYHLITRLAAKHELYLFCLNDSKVAKEYVEHLEGICAKVQVHTIPRWKLLASLVRAAIGRIPFQVSYFYHGDAQKKIDLALNTFDPDHVLCQLVRTSEYVRERFDLHRTLDFMDTLSKGMERREETAPWYLKPVFREETRRLIRYENLMFDLFDERVIISAQDRDFIYHPDRDAFNIIPNGVDTEFFHPQKKEKQADLLFTGNMNYPPNIDSVMFLANEILPRVRKTLPNTSLLISGVDPSQRIRDLAVADENIHVTGWVKDIRDSYASARLFVAPMQIGTGLQNKLLEAMAMQIPCITSPLANNAVGAVPNESILIGNEPAEYAEHIVRLLTNEDERDRIAENGNSFVRNQFDWDIAAEKLNDVILGKQAFTADSRNFEPASHEDQAR